MYSKRFLPLALIAALLLVSCGGGGAQDETPTEIRVGHFANLTHVQPLIGLKQGTFQKEMGAVQVKPIIFGAGPAVIEALFAREIDIAYIGPSPAINGYTKSDGAALRVIAGAVSGGASLVVRGDSGISNREGLKGKRLGSPQAGNTQDVALRHYLQAGGLKTQEQGGDVRVVNISNADILTLFSRKELDGAWVPEPWATRLINEADGKLLVDERDLWPQGQFPTTIVIVRKAFLDKHPGLVDQWLKAHVEVTDWVIEHPAEAKAAVQAEILRLAGATISQETLDQSFARMSLNTDPLVEAIDAGAEHAFALGFLGDKKPDLSQLVDQAPLRRVSAPLQ